MKNENEIKNWSVLGKGYENTLNEDVSNYSYTYITKRFTGTEKEFNEFCDSLYDSIECWKEIDRGESKPRETPKRTNASTNVKSKYKFKKKYKATLEDSFKKHRPKKDKWGMTLRQ